MDPLNGIIWSENQLRVNCQHHSNIQSILEYYSTTDYVMINCEWYLGLLYTKTITVWRTGTQSVPQSLGCRT